MAVQIDANIVVAGAAVVGSIASVFAYFYNGLKGSIKLLFQKKDEIDSDLQKYKLHVAETYVNRQQLKEQLDGIFGPLQEMLKEVKSDLRDLREHKHD